MNEIRNPCHPNKSKDEEQRHQKHQIKEQAVKPNEKLRSELSKKEPKQFQSKNRENSLLNTTEEILGKKLDEKPSSYENNNKHPRKLNRYPSFSHVTCTVPSHIVKARPRWKRSRIVFHKYPSFDYVTHKIDDRNNMQRATFKRWRYSSVKLPSYSYVESTIPKVGANNPITKTQKQYFNDREDSTLSIKSEKSQVIDNNYYYEKSVKKLSVYEADKNCNKRYLKKNPLVSDLNRKRVEEVFKGGTRLLATVIPFLKPRLSNI